MNRRRFGRFDLAAARLGPRRDLSGIGGGLASGAGTGK